MQAVAPVVRTTLITCEYNPAPVNGTAAGLAWVIMHDNSIISWLVDEGGALPPVPVILGHFPDKAPDTMPIRSPQWASRETWEVMVADTMRGSPPEFFTFIATNNGAKRPIYANFSDAGLITDFASWARSHPTLALEKPPNVA